MDGGVDLGAAQALVVGQASLTIASLGGGTHSITAVYSGSANYNGSTSSAVAQVVACDQLITGSTGSVTAVAGQSTCLSGAKLTGSVTVATGGSLSVVNSTISGGITMTGSMTSASLTSVGSASESLTVCGSTIGGNVRVTGVGGFVLIGDRLENACAGNTLKGSLSILGTGGGLAVAENRITGGVTIANNSGAGPAAHTAPEIEANRIGGYLSAYGNSPAATDDGRPNIVRGWVVWA